MLHPAGLRVNLLMFSLINGDHIPSLSEDHTTSAGRALVNGGDVFRHIHLSTIFPLYNKTPREFGNPQDDIRHIHFFEYIVIIYSGY
jgi:hypothetical protein